jgi:peptide/nickel transport system permease protein
MPSRKPFSFWFGVAILGAFLILGTLGPAIAPHGVGEPVADAWAPFSSQTPLGADNLGRDVLSRLIFAIQLTLLIAASSTLLSFAIGMSLGFIAAVVGGIIDQALGRVVDIMMSIPTLILALVVLALLPHSMITLIFVMGVLDSSRVFRVSRALAGDTAAMEFVEAARLRGEGASWIIRREILPSTLPPIVSEAGLRFCFMILFLSALSFLGFGIQPPQTDLGGMVRENANALGFGLIVPLIPAGAIVLLTVSVNLLVDWQINRLAQPSSH